MKYSIVACLILLQSLSFAARAGRSEVVSSEEFGKGWPFTVSSGRLMCAPPGAVNGKTLYVLFRGIDRED